ncbi:MAG: YkgJ family cysteine cluster protein [Candidatus Omnitrophota bacterium]
MIKQFVTEEACLRCQGCCRFSHQDSVWSPCLLEEEIQVLLDKNIPPACISLEKRIAPILESNGEGFICPFLNKESNKCAIYDFRPFECQLYPFLLNLRHNKVLLTVDLHCPYIKEKLNTPEFKEYVRHLALFLNSAKQKRTLKDNPQILAAYEEVLEIIELEGPDEIK